MERQTTIKKLFHEDGIQFAIPAFQRAYSWGSLHTELWLRWMEN